MPESKEESPFRLPIGRKISEEEADHLSVQRGGVGGPSLDVPTFMRKEQKKPQELPKHSPGLVKTSKN